MTENPKNLIFRCDRHRLRPIGITADTPLVGCHVKKVFEADLPMRPPHIKTETMWVLVTEQHGAKLKGTGDNDPLFCLLNYGDEVELDVSEIVEILSEN